MFVVFIWWSCFLFSSSISDPLWGQRSHCVSPGTPDGAKTSLRLEVLMPQPARCVIVWIVCEHRCMPACCVFSETQRRVSGLCSLTPHFIPLRPVPSYWARGWAGGHDISAILASPISTWPCLAFYVVAGIKPQVCTASSLNPLWHLTICFCSVFSVLSVLKWESFPLYVCICLCC